MTKDQTKEKFICAYNNYCDDIFKYCFFRVYDRDLAKDLAQETFIKMWKYLADGKEIENFRAFAYKVAYHLVVDNSKKKKEYSLDGMLELGIEFSDGSKNKEQDTLDTLSIVQEINKLGGKYAEIVKMKYIDGLSTEEISLSLGVSSNMVYVRLHRGLEKIKENI